METKRSFHTHTHTHTKPACSQGQKREINFFLNQYNRVLDEWVRDCIICPVLKVPHTYIYTCDMKADRQRRNPQ